MTFFEFLDKNILTLTECTEALLGFILSMYFIYSLFKTIRLLKIAPKSKEKEKEKRK